MISGYGHGCTENGMPSAWAESGCARGSGLSGTQSSMDIIRTWQRSYGNGQRWRMDLMLVWP